MTIKVISGKTEKSIICSEGEKLLSVLQRNGYDISARCGGNGKCGKCKVKILGGTLGGKTEGFVLSCKVVVESDIIIEVDESVGSGLTDYASGKHNTDGEDGYGIALDIGTTTLAFSLVNMKTGEEIEKFGTLNRQGIFGSDVISRIMSAEAGKSNQLHHAIIEQTADAINRFSTKHNIDKFKRLAVCGNTTMLHFFLDKDVSGIGRYPFTAQFLDTVRVSGDKLGLNVSEVVVLPSVSAYYGADAVVGAMVSNIRGGNNVIVDIGTNGEIMLSANEITTATSTAAGPCFEGANIECGTGGVDGAINSVSICDSKINYTTIGNCKPIGICGAGLIDAVAVMLKTGIIDEDGCFCNDEEKFYISQDVYISQKDIRSFQLAKSAICAGIKVLINNSGITYDDIDNLYIAGGLGFYLNKDNAIAVGLLPRELYSKIKVVGNSALAGTVECLVMEEKISQAEQLAKSTKYIDLSSDANFVDEYVGNMTFGEGE